VRRRLFSRPCDPNGFYVFYIVHVGIYMYIYYEFYFFISKPACNRTVNLVFARASDEKKKNVTSFGNRWRSVVCNETGRRTLRLRTSEIKKKKKLSLAECVYGTISLGILLGPHFTEWGLSEKMWQRRLSRLYLVFRTLVVCFCYHREIAETTVTTPCAARTAALYT